MRAMRWSFARAKLAKLVLVLVLLLLLAGRAGGEST